MLYFLYKRRKEIAIMADIKKKKRQGSCESCEFYDYDEFYESYSCRVNLDQDEQIRFLSGDSSSCPYYRYYDEYKSVNKQI